MNVEEFVELAKQGEPVYISVVDKAFSKLSEKSEIYIVLDLIEQGKQKDFTFFVPSDFEEGELVESYFFGKIYNIISTLGGVKLNIYYDKSNKKIQKMVEMLDQVFGINVSKKDRVGYACAVNVTDRIIEALYKKNFCFSIYDIKEKPTHIFRQKKKDSILKYTQAVDKLNGLMCGIDIGGSDIKLAVSYNKDILCFKEFDWNPQVYETIEKIVEPILSLVKLMQIKATVDMIENNQNVSEILYNALKKDATIDEINECVAIGMAAYKDKVILFDGIGVSFPDVIIRNKIVGGECSKLKGVRDNEKVDFEKEFVKLRDLNLMLMKHCKSDGKVKITNDGPMASYTATVEQAYGSGDDSVKEGIIAHSLGTELGTGWVDENGDIPEIPLEAYNYVIDIGSYDQKDYVADDLRSIKNFNTAISGTVQKYASQYGVFRLAIKYFKQERMDLYDEMVDNGFVAQKGDKLFVPTEPIDYRKSFLEFVMSLPERETCEVCNRIFREIGEFIAVTCAETDEILRPKVKKRVLFGRVVKNKRCFELMKEGARRINENIELSVADGDMANTPLMKRLHEDDTYTVAQFAQAVGSIYFAMCDRI